MGVKIGLLPYGCRNQLYILDCHWHKQHPRDVEVAHLSQSRHNLQTEETKVSDLKCSDILASNKLTEHQLYQERNTLNKFSGNTGSPPASNLEPPVFRLTTRMELLSLSATSNSCISVIKIPMLSAMRSETEWQKKSQQ